MLLTGVVGRPFHTQRFSFCDTECTKELSVEPHINIFFVVSREFLSVPESFTSLIRSEDLLSYLLDPVLLFSNFVPCH